MYISSFIDILGWVGALLLSLCGLPQLFKTYKTRTTKGLSLAMLCCWLIGEICLLVFIMSKAFEWQLLFNSSLNIVIVSFTVILYIKYRND